MFCSTVSFRKMDGSCGRYVIPSRARSYIGRSVISSSSRKTFPLVGRILPTIMLNVVVLPAPLGPSSPTISPGATARPTSSTAGREP
jgi:hypothetical protein